MFLRGRVERRRENGRHDTKGRVWALRAFLPTACSCLRIQWQLELSCIFWRVNLEGLPPPHVVLQCWQLLSGPLLIVQLMTAEKPLHFQGGRREEASLLFAAFTCLYWPLLLSSLITTKNLHTTMCKSENRKRNYKVRGENSQSSVIILSFMWFQSYLQIANTWLHIDTHSHSYSLAHTVFPESFIITY